MRVAVEKRGVAVVVIPGDVALAECAATVPRWLLPAAPVLQPSSTDIERAAGILNEPGSRVTILAGAGCAGAHAELVELAGRLKAPVVHALRGKEHVEYDNPYDVGMTGLIGFASGYAAMKSCDTLLMLGTDFPYRQFYPETARIIQVDQRAEALGNRAALTLGVVGNVRETLMALLPRIAARSDDSHLQDALVDYRRSRAALDALAESGPGSRLIHPQYLARLVSELAAPDAVFTADVGTPTAWAARYLRMNGQRRLIGSFNHGSMANAMIQAIGAQCAFPARQVISLSGDGGFTMMMGEFVTLLQSGLPVKIVLLNNGTLGFVEMEMKANGFLDTGCSLTNSNFAALATAVGIKGVRVERPHDLRGALAEVLAHEAPALLDVVSARQELIMPPKTTPEQAYNFASFLTKAVLDGRGTQLIDLAKVNLTR